MIILNVLAGLSVAFAAPAPKTLDRARALAAKLTLRLPGPPEILICPSCDADWVAGGEPLGWLERVLISVAEDVRVEKIADVEALGNLIAEHITRISAPVAGEAPSKITGKETLCGLSRPPCELFSPKLFAEFCAPPQGL